jgi:hypothetical protein
VSPEAHLFAVEHFEGLIAERVAEKQAQLVSLPHSKVAFGTPVVPSEVRGVW